MCPGHGQLVGIWTLNLESSQKITHQLASASRSSPGLPSSWGFNIKEALGLAPAGEDLLRKSQWARFPMVSEG